MISAPANFSRSDFLPGQNGDSQLSLDEVHVDVEDQAGLGFGLIRRGMGSMPSCQRNSIP